MFGLSDLEDSFSPPVASAGPTAPSSGLKRRASGNDSVGRSASPDLKKGRTVGTKMKRTPQQVLTQPKLTSMLQKRGHDPPVAGPAGPRSHDRSLSEGDSWTSTETVRSPSNLGDMDTSSPGVVAVPNGDKGSQGQLVTTDFLLRSLKENTDHIINTFNISLGLLAQKVGANTDGVAANRAEIDRQAKLSEDRWTDLKGLTSRVEALERGGATAPATVVGNRAILSEDYRRARRSMRIWPVPGGTETELWGETGEFLHNQLAISTEDIGQDDVEDVRRVVGERLPEGIRDEVVVMFKDPRKRDLAMVSSVNLAKYTDGNGRPTAGTRLEVPDELADTFRLLTRFGTRLRARHGQGTKRHIKFDDYVGSLYANVKLPGDTSWTKVTPSMAQADLESSIREEQRAQGKRLAAKLVPGPRERLNRPMIPTTSAAVTATGAALTGPAPQADGRRPRWSRPAPSRPQP